MTTRPSHLDEDQLSAALDGELDPEAAEHGDTCDECRARLAHWRRVVGLVAVVPFRPSDDQVEEAVRTALTDGFGLQPGRPSAGQVPGATGRLDGWGGGGCDWRLDGWGGGGCDWRLDGWGGGGWVADPDGRPPASGFGLPSGSHRRRGGRSLDRRGRGRGRGQPPWRFRPGQGHGDGKRGRFTDVGRVIGRCGVGDAWRYIGSSRRSRAGPAALRPAITRSLLTQL